MTPSRCRASASSAEPNTPSPTDDALVDQRREAPDLVARPSLDHRLLDRAEGPRRLSGGRQADVGGDLGQRRVERRLQRRLERFQVLAARLLGARVVDDAVGRAEVLGHLLPVPRLARHDHAGGRAQVALQGVEQRLVAGRHPARNSLAVLGAGTNETRRFLGRLRSRLVTSSSRRPGTFQEKSSASTRFSVATGTSMVRPSSGGARLEDIADREGQPLAPPTPAGSRPRAPPRPCRG